MLIHASESALKQLPDYPTANGGDIDAAFNLVVKTINDDVVNSLSSLAKHEAPILISVHAKEAVGVNAIPEVIADFLCNKLALDKEKSVVQANLVNHTGSGGFARIAKQVVFSA